MGISLHRDWNMLHDTFQYFLGGSLLQKNGGRWKTTFTKEESLAGIEQLIRLQKEGLIYFEPHNNPAATDWIVMAQGLVDGRYDAVFGGLYMISVFNDNPQSPIYAVSLPVLRGKLSQTFLGGSHLAMTSVKGRKLIEHLISDELCEEMPLNTVALPASVQALKSFFHKDPRWSTLNIEKILESAQPYPSIPQWGNIIENQIGLNQFYNALKSISDGRDFYTVSVELDAAAKNIQNAIDKPLLIEKANENWIWYIIIIILIITILVILRYIILKIGTVKVNVERFPVYLEPIKKILLPVSNCPI